MRGPRLNFYAPRAHECLQASDQKVEKPRKSQSCVEPQRSVQFLCTDVERRILLVHLLSGSAYARPRARANEAEFVFISRPRLQIWAAQTSFKKKPEMDRASQERSLFRASNTVRKLDLKVVAINQHNIEAFVTILAARLHSLERMWKRHRTIHIF